MIHTATTSIRGDVRPARLRRGALTLASIVAALSAAPAPAASNNVRISALTDLSFGAIVNLNADSVASEDVCVYSNTTANAYRVTASGSGSGGAFALSSGANTLPFEVQWAQAAGQSSGAQLLSNVPLTGQTTAATQQVCNAGPSSSATLVVILRSTALSSASAGAYSGTLTLLVGPE